MQSACSRISERVIPCHWWEGVVTSISVGILELGRPASGLSGDSSFRGLSAVVGGASSMRPDSGLALSELCSCCNSAGSNEMESVDRRADRSVAQPAVVTRVVTIRM